MEREPQSQSPIVRFTEATKLYASKEAENSPQFKIALAQITRELGGDQNPEAGETAENMIKQGIGMITQKVGMLPAFSNPENREQIVEKLKKDKVKGAWIDILANWNVQEDPYGENVLLQCKDADIKEIMSKAALEKDPNKKKQIEIKAKAIAYGEDLIIGYYQSQTDSNGLQMAA